MLAVVYLRTLWKAAYQPMKGSILGAPGLSNHVDNDVGEDHCL
jgi:hypothetical protein